MKRIQSACLVVMMLFAARLNAQTSAPAEMVDNPVYKSWASQKPGTKIMMKSDMAMGGMNMLLSVAQTLTEITPARAAIAVSTEMNLGGQNQRQQGTQDIAAKVPKGQEQLPPDIKGSIIKETGKETLDIDGKKYECTIREFEGTSAQGKVAGKMWNNPQIPGNVAKMELTIDGPMLISTKTSVVSIEAK